MFRLRKSRQHKDEDEQVKIGRLEQAEIDLVTLKTRATLAINALEQRRQNNHWRESIEHMIQGGGF